MRIRSPQLTEAESDKRIIYGYLTGESMADIAAAVGIARTSLGNRITRLRLNGCNLPIRRLRPKFFRNDYVNELNRYIRDVWREIDGV